MSNSVQYEKFSRKWLKIQGKFATFDYDLFICFRISTAKTLPITIQYRDSCFIAIELQFVIVTRSISKIEYSKNSLVRSTSNKGICTVALFTIKPQKPISMTILAYNILRIIGQESMRSKGSPKTKHPIKRRRLRTVISSLILIASHAVERGRNLVLSLGKSNI